MKRTTYILIGILLSGFLIMVIGIILIPSFGNMHKPNAIFFRGEPIREQLPPFTTVKLFYPDAETQNQRFAFGDCRLSIFSSGGVTNTFICPEDFRKYLELEVVNDTLMVKFNYSVKDLPAEMKDRDFVSLNCAGSMSLDVAQDLRDIDNQINGWGLRLVGLQQDSLSLSTYTAVAVDSCHLHSFIVTNANELSLNSGEIGSLHLDLDGVRNWDVNTQDCRIDTEYLTGECSNSVLLQKGECRKMYWTPKREDSELRVALKEKSCISVLD